MTQLLIHMLRTLSPQSGSNLAWLNALNDPCLAKAIDRILEDPFAPQTVESLEESVHYEPVHLCRWNAWRSSAGFRAAAIFRKPSRNMPGNLRQNFAPVSVSASLEQSQLSVPKRRL